MQRIRPAPRSNAPRLRHRLGDNSNRVVATAVMARPGLAREGRA